MSSTSPALKIAKTVAVTFAIIAAFLVCALIAACGLRAAQTGRMANSPHGAAMNLPPLAPGAAREAAVQAGRQIAHQIAEGNADALFAQFSPSMAKSVSLAQVKQLLSPSLVPENAPAQEIVSGTSDAPVYLGRYLLQNGNGQLLVLAGFDAPGPKGKIASLLITPQPVPFEQAKGSKQGQAVARLIAKKDVAGLYALFAPSMASSFSKAQIAAIMEKLLPSSKPLASKIGEMVVPTEGDSDAALMVCEDFAQKTDAAFRVVLTLAPNTQKIVGLRFVPGLPNTLAPDPHTGYQMKNKLRLPFVPGDKWTVVWGGDTRAQNYHVDYADQRHALDIVAMQNGTTHKKDGKTLTDYFAYGRKIVAPADGTVIEAVNNLPDNAIGQTDATHAAGNHVLLDLGHSEYVLLAHLQSGSVRVKTGQKVNSGEPLGLCGNSGNTSEPHLHIHVQDGPQLFHGNGLPITFTNYLSNGRAVTSGSPVKKDMIEDKP